MTILLIDSDKRNLNLVQSFINKLEIEDCYQSQDYSHSIEIIDAINPDLVICNPHIFKKETMFSLLKRIHHLSISLLWLIPDYNDNQTVIILKKIQN